MGRRARFLAVSATGALALVGFVNGAASAAVAPDSSTITISGSGTGTVYMTKAYIANMAAHNITMTAMNPISVTLQDTYTTTIWTTKSVNVGLNPLSGTVEFNGGTLVTNTVTGQQLLLTDIRFNATNHTIDYTVQTPAGALTIHALDLAGTQSAGIKGSTLTYSSSELFVDPAAASALDSVLGTDAFLDTELFGGFTTSFTL